MRENYGNGANIPQWAKIAVSLLILSLIILHLVFPKWAIDSITITLLVLLLIVWVLPWIKTLKIPGGTEIHMHDILKAEESLAKADVPKEQDRTLRPNLVIENEADKLSSLEHILGKDPNLALASLRIEIEKRLIALGKRNAINFSSLTGISKMIRLLRDRRVIDYNFAQTLSKMVAVGNLAIHGAHISSDVAQRALDVGHVIIKGLDELIEEK